MILFASIFLAVYSLVHWLVYCRLKRLLNPGRGGKIVITIWCALMVVMIPASRIMEHMDLLEPASWAAWTGYVWMGFCLLALAMSAATAILQLILWALRPKRDIWRRREPTRAWAVLTLAASVTAMVYGLYEAGHPRLVKLALSSPGIEASVNPLRIVHLSDLHIGATTRISYLQEMAARINQLKPDLIVSTGDMVDGKLPVEGRIGQVFSQIKAPLGKFAIMGNHEFYAGGRYSTEFMQKCGYRMLRGQSVTLKGVINLVGVDYTTPGNDTGREVPLLQNLQNGLFTILLKHQPVVHPRSKKLFDLMLSGHTHGGQFFPYKYLIKALYPMLAGLLPLDWGGYVYVSRGTGTWGPPIRILAPPEITCIEITNGKSLRAINSPGGE